MDGLESRVRNERTPRPRRGETGARPLASRRLEAPRLRRGETSCCREGTSAQDGFALVFVLLGMLAALGVASAAVATAIGQARSAAAAGRVAEARAGARAGLEQALARAGGASTAAVGDSAVPLLAGALSAHVAWSVVSIRASAEFHLLIGEARVRGGVPWREGRIAWWMDPVARIGAHRAVVESAAGSSGARVEGDSALAPREGVPGCGQIPAIAGVFGGSAPPLRGPLPSPPEWGGPPGSGYEAVRLGWFNWPRIREMADLTFSGSAPSPPPGSPPSLRWLGLVAGSGSAVVRDSDGAGVLVVDGDLTLEPGGAWKGLVLASGSVTLRSSARILGLVRSGGSVVTEPNAVIDGSPCAALASLANAPSLLRPLALPGRSWAGPILPGAK